MTTALGLPLTEEEEEETYEMAIDAPYPDGWDASQALRAFVAGTASEEDCGCLAGLGYVCRYKGSWILSADGAKRMDIDWSREEQTRLMN